MSIWRDVFEIYQSVQSDDMSATADTKVSLPSPAADSAQTDNGSKADEAAQQTVYVFAYIDDGNGNITRNIAVEDRITMLELKNQELEHRYNSLLEQLDEQDESSSDEV